MFYKYRLFTTDGDEAGEAEYAVTIKPGEIIWAAAGKLRVLDVVPVLEEDSPYVGLLKVAPAT